ncbi:MAG: hypothetical protein ABI624_11355 [Casimicrobiaceae bacterium]
MTATVTAAQRRTLAEQLEARRHLLRASGCPIRKAHACALHVVEVRLSQSALLAETCASRNLSKLTGMQGASFS